MDVEWLILADAAQVVGQKLYLLGGGYDRISLPKEPPAPHSMAVAVSFRVPWNETNRKHDFQIEVLDGDGANIAAVNGQLEVGRPPGLSPGQDQRSQVAVNMAWNVQKLGSYEVVARITDSEARHFPFYVIAAPGVGTQKGPS